MSLPAAPKVPPQVAEQAVRWLVELQGGADDERLRQAWSAGARRPRNTSRPGATSRRSTSAWPG